MRSRFIRGRTLLLTGLFVLLLGFLVSGNRSPAPLGVFRLSDGTMVRVRAVTFGRGPHQYMQGQVYHQWLGGLPRPVLVRLGARVHALDLHPAGEDPEKLFLWGETQPWVQDSFLRLRFSLLDEHGCEFPHSGGGSGAPGGMPMTYAFFNVPRRGSTMRLRLYEKQEDGVRVAGELELSDPARSVAEPGSPEPLPVTRSLGDVACTLTGLEFEDRWGFRRARKLRAKLRVTRRGKPTSDYRIQEVRIADGRGNEESWGRDGRAYHRKGDGVLLAEGLYPFCRKERSVRVVVRLEPERPGSRSLEEARFTVALPWLVEEPGGSVAPR